MAQQDPFNYVPNVDSFDGRAGEGAMFDFQGKGDKEYDPYEAWSRQLDASGKTPLREILEFITLAKPVGEQGQRIDLFATLGMWQLNAPCNNSTEILLLLNTEWTLLQQGIAYFCETEQPWYPPLPDDEDTPETEIVKRILPRIGDRFQAVAAAARCAEIRAQTERIRADVSIAKREGLFVDYWHLKQMFKEADPDRLLNGMKHMEMPFFLKECFSEVMQAAAGTYPLHIEALHARLLSRFQSSPDDMQQRLLQGIANNQGGHDQNGQQGKL